MADVLIALGVGFWLGTNFGFLLMALMIANKRSEVDHERNNYDN